MAGLDTTFLNNVTRSKFLKVLKNNLYNSSPFFSNLFERGRIQDMTGVSLQWAVIMTKHASLGVYEGYDVFANQPVNPTTIATLSPASYYAALAISGEEERKNTGNTERLLDMVKIQFDNAMATLKDRMYTDAFGAGTTVGGRNVLIGLAAAVDNDNTYANIVRSSNAQWQSNINATAYTDAQLKDPTHAGYLPSLMRDAYTDATHDHSPDLIITTKKLYNVYQDIAGVQNLRFDNSKANLGFRGVEFGPGVTLTFDDFQTALRMDFLALQDWSVFVYPGANFDLRGEGWMVAQNQDAKVAQIIWSGQMRLDSPWHQAALTALGSA